MGWLVGASGAVLSCGGRSGLEVCHTCADSSAAGALPSTHGGGGTGALSAGGAPNLAGSAALPPVGGGGTGSGVGGGGRASAGVAGSVSAAGEAAASAGAGGEGGAAEPPVALLLVDASLSMFFSGAWAATYEALTGPGGPIERYQDRVRFGFASYRGSGQMSEDDPECAEITRVPFAFDNVASIRDVYGALTASRRRPETPTGHTVTRVTQDLLAAAPDARKYILFFSDGAPDTCSTTRPQCGQDRAIFAVQQAFRAGIETHAIGIGYGTEDCDAQQARCGRDHFQDIANAGRGWPVQAPPAVYSTLPCAEETGGELLAEYAEKGVFGAYYWAAQPAEVQRAVEAVIEQILGR